MPENIEIYGIFIARKTFHHTQKSNFCWIGFDCGHSSFGYDLSEILLRTFKNEIFNGVIYQPQKEKYSRVIPYSLVLIKKI